MKKGDEIRRWLRFEFDDGSHVDFEIGRATILKKETDKVLFHLDRLPDGKHLMICSQEACPDDKKIENIRMIREG